MTKSATAISFLLAGTAIVTAPAQAQHAAPASPRQPAPQAPAHGAVTAVAQPPATETVGEEEAEEGEIVVVGQRDPNAVIGDIPPENTLIARDIRAYGASTVAELLDAVGAQTHSSRGRDSGPPVVLLNGKRISGFREIRDLPPEAILRMDILPEEVALKYGYRADQRVVNIVLRPRFRSTAARLDGELSTAGGRAGATADVTRLMIGENGRTTLNAHVEGNSALTESERLIAYDPTGGSSDPRDFRTLIGSRRLGRLGGTVNRTMFGDVSSTLDAQVEASEGRSLLGPSLIDADPLRRDSDSLSGHLGAAFNGQKDKWRWSLTGNYDISRAVTLTDREDALSLTASQDRARSLNQTARTDFVANGPLAALPAGPANLTVRLGADRRDLDSRARRGTAVSASDLGRTRGSAAVNIDLPVSRRNKAFAALGNLSLNANAEVENLSDFGTLTTVGGGVFWSPFTSRFNLIASFTREEGAPSLQQLGDPVIVTPNSRIFDYSTGQTVLVNATTGGNPALSADERTVWKLGGTFKPSDKIDLDLRADFTRTRIDDPLARFPGPTAAVEAAFPGRFTRDSAARLVAVDFRPVNYDRSARDEFRWGFNFTRPLRTARPSQSTMTQLREQFRRQGGTLPPPPAGERMHAPAADGPPAPSPGGGEVVAFEHGNEGARGPGGGRGFGGGRGGSGGGAFGGRGGRLQLSAYHTIALKDEVRIRRGLPTLDYLDGEASEGGGGRPRHRVEVDAGYFNNGLGARLSLDWQGGTRVDGGPNGTLDFDPLAKVNLGLFANLGERLDLIARRPWLRGTQVRLSVDNIFDEKQRVRDAAGLTPINYQPDLLDPQGRTVRFSLRKLFLPRPQFLRRTLPAAGGAPRRGE